MSQWAIIQLLGAAMALILVVQSYRTYGHNLDRTATLAVIWMAIIGGLALVLQRWGE